MPNQTSLTIWEIARLENRTLFWFQTFEFRLSNLLKVPTFPLTKSLTYRLERLAFWPGPLADRRCIGRSRGTVRTDECSAGTFPSLLGSYCRGRTEEKQIVSSIIYKWISVLISLNFKLLNWNHRYPSKFIDIHSEFLVMVESTRHWISESEDKMMFKQLYSFGGSHLELRIVQLASGQLKSFIVYIFKPTQISKFPNVALFTV